MNWFAQYGDRLLSLVTVACTLATTDAKELGLDPHAVAWLSLLFAVGTAAHTLFFPNTPAPQILPPPVKS